MINVYKMNVSYAEGDSFEYIAADTIDAAMEEMNKIIKHRISKVPTRNNWTAEIFRVEKIASDVHVVTTI